MCSELIAQNTPNANEIFIKSTSEIDVDELPKKNLFPMMIVENIKRRSRFQ
jgi:hypothetical protein